MIRFIRLLPAIAIMASAFCGSVNAQSGKGSIYGKVTDASGSVLQGASVELQPGGIELASDRGGTFFANDLAPGSYTITVSYVGFALFTKDVSIMAGQNLVLDIPMAVSSQSDQVIVTSERASGEAEALNRERTADNVLQVLPAEVIRSLPNANMADAIGRLPSVSLERDEGEGKYVQIRGTEPRLTNGTIDGVNIPSPESGIRQIKFDTIPSDLVESVEINKTLQANQDGDGIGGSVNLVTKTATERPTVALYGLGGISPINGSRNNYETTGTVGKRFGAEHRLGVLIGGSYDWNGRGIDDVEPVPDLNTLSDGSTQRYFDSMDVREYRYYRTRWGIAGSADYKLSEGSDIYVRGLFSSFHNFGDRWVYTLNDNNPDASLLNGSGGAPSFNNSVRRPRYLISSVVLGGKHVLSTTWFSWDISASRSSEDDNGYGFGSFNVPFPSTYSSPCTYDPAATGNSLTPRFSPLCFSEAYNTSIYALTDLNISRGKTAQVNLQAAGAVGKRYRLGSHLATIEVGGKFRNAHKYDHTYTDDYAIPLVGGDGPDKNDIAPGAAIIPFDKFNSTFKNNHYYGGAYKFGPAADYFATQRYVLANANQFDFSSGAAGNSNFYNYVEQVSAGYIMNTLDFNKFRLVAGLRVEGTNLRTLSFQSGCPDPAKCGFNLPGGGSYTTVLPSASLRYAIDSNTNIRLAFSRGISRPNPSDVAQAFTVSPANGSSTGSVSLGNLNLKAESANNYDLLFEHYLNPFGAIQAGIFYKQLSNPIVQTDTVFTNYQPTPQYPVGRYVVSQPLNIGTAHLYGFEISYLQRFSFLPGMFSGLGLSANYSYTDSGTTGLYNRLDHPHLLRQAPHTWNISPTYDRRRLSLRVGLSYNSANIYAYQYVDGSAQAANPDANGPTPGGVRGPSGDTYFYPHFQVDAQGSVRLAKGVTFIAYGLNLNNEVFGFYNGSSQYLIQREYYTQTYGLGLRWSPTHEK